MIDSRSSDSLLRMFAAACDGRLQPAEQEQLAQLLIHDERVREQYAAFAQLHTDLRFFAKADGLFPGVYEAHLHCWKVPPTMDGPRAVSHLPAKYGKGDTSGLKLTVEEGSSAKEFNIDITDVR